jgi:hypothetical protein
MSWEFVRRTHRRRWFPEPVFDAFSNNRSIEIVQLAIAQKPSMTYLQVSGSRHWPGVSTDPESFLGYVEPHLWTNPQSNVIPRGLSPGNCV